MLDLKGFRYMIAIIDYDAGNIKSVEKAVLALGEVPVVTRDREKILSADKVILPGVGSFGDAMEKIRSYNLEEVIHEVVEKRTPFLGICLGLQLLFEESEECVGVKGLGVLKGKIMRIPDKEGLKIPHIGWNNLDIKMREPIFEGVGESPYVYFVHSYHLQTDAPVVSATTSYGKEIQVAVQKDNIFALQFHPEKSGDVGLRLLKNFGGL